ncbi:glycosyl transferase family 2 [Desulfotomaculum nigrificans CO-1-SRB]|uniref:Glycosyl transferase family 2 n=1 Tax=Desulfotomaculum nigrificans (strain DSM 14880 / VKM B-2319 / CO-1-SRB) TaxID=868595 RepID=F6B517_DESCC|nr:glycosyltransferase [Desulfotomaculum nigrificans]AEF95389.1 glycosyl transferase family 2 [Desulfotomaculum nigrificans CO-1-SRB]
MWATLEYLLLLILACYGIYRLTRDIFSALRSEPGPPVSMLVVVQNREHDVEYLMRRLAVWQRHQWVKLDIVVVDDNSRDDTRVILQGLQQKMPFRMIAVNDRELSGDYAGADRALLTGLLHCHNALVWLVDMRRLPQEMMAGKVFRVFFCQGWR